MISANSFISLSIQTSNIDLGELLNGKNSIVNEKGQTWGLTNPPSQLKEEFLQTSGISNKNSNWYSSRLLGLLY